MKKSIVLGFLSIMMFLTLTGCRASTSDGGDRGTINVISREDGSGTREYLNIFLSSNKITPRQIMVLGSNYAVKEAVKSNLGVSIISKLVTDSEKDTLPTISLDDAYNRYFSFITPKDIKPSSTTTLFIDELYKFSNISK